MPRLLNREGLPWTAGISLSDTITLIFLSVGALPILFGLYLAYWLSVSHRRQAALRWYVALVAFYGITAFADHYRPSLVPGFIELLCVALWIAAEFILRHEIMSAYRDHEGFELTVSPLWTFLFGAVYRNYIIPPYTPRPLPAN